jgi:eukaryotic-like serine/threonine-protein kinase
VSSCVGCTAEVQLEDTFCARCGAPVTDPFIGLVVGDRYRIVSRIGIGGMGAVYRAEHTMMRRDLAIKVLLPELSGKDEFARRFEREAESASRLAHPNIISVTDFGHMQDGSLFLVMEFLAGESLSAAIAGGPMPLPRALNILTQMLRGLEHAHAAGVIHRDLKPENIMLVEREGQRDVVKILDFGIAKVTQPQSGGEALTQAGVIFGTPEYLSPEQALGEAVDARADIYAAGVIFYEMLAGRKPFESEDKVKIISMHLSHAPPRIRDVNPTVDVPAPLEQVILQALDKSRDNRFATATAFMCALDEAQAPEDDGAEAGEPAPPAGARGRAFGAMRRLASLPSGRWGAAAVGAVLLVGGFAVVKRSGRPAAALVAPAAPPAPPAPDLAERFKKIESWLENGNLGSARRGLEQVLSERPKDGRVRYMLGRVAYADEKHQEALAHYREAITLDAGFRGDLVLLAHLDTLVSDGKEVDAALDLMIERVGAPAADLLVKVANEGSDLPRRQRAAAALEDIGEGKRVDHVSMAILELKKATSCEEKKVMVVKLRELADPRALPTIRGLRGRSLGPLRFGGSDTACMKKELTETIKELEKKGGVAERRSRRGR